jgi:hypothetical protein
MLGLFFKFNILLTHNSLELKYRKLLTEITHIQCFYYFMHDNRTVYIKANNITS